MLASTEFAACATLLATAYFILAPRYTTVKQRAWILTTLLSGTMTLSSIPFLYAFITSGFDVQAVPHYPGFAPHISRLFQAYLVVDLVIGALCYSKYVTLLSGWIHHLVYIVVLHFVVVYDWNHVFCLALILELPTFLLAVASVYPTLRNDVLFAAAYLSTRIILHLVFMVLFMSPYGRASVNGNWAPAGLFVAAFPLHASWFYGCIKGFIRRHKQAQAAQAAAAAASAAESVSATPEDTPLPTPRDEDVGSTTKDPAQSPKAVHVQLPTAEDIQLVAPRSRDAMLDLRLLRHLAAQQPVPLRIRAMLAAASDGRYARLAARAQKLYERVEPARLAAFRARVSGGVTENRALREEIMAY